MATISASLGRPVCLYADARTPEGSALSTASRTQLFGSYSGLVKTSSSFKSVPVQSLSSQRSQTLQVYARGTQKFSSEGSKGKPKFGTQFFKSKDADEDEDEQPKKSRSLSLSTSAFSGLQFFGRGRQVDANTVFVASATGQVGARIVLELLHDGFRVRAGVQDLREAQKVAELASQYGLISSQEVKRLNVVEFKFDDQELTAKAIGNAAKVVVTVGEGELGPGGKVTYQDAARIVQASSLAKINNLVVISPVDSAVALADGPAGFFAKIFSFFSGSGGRGSLTFSDLIDNIVDTNLNFTIIQPVQTEGVSDIYGATAKVILAPEGSGLQGKISKLQVASVVSSALSNIGAAENKVFEIAASPEATAAPVVDLLSKIEADGRRAALLEAKAKAEAEEEARQAAEEARAALETASQLEEEARKLAAEETRAASAAEKARARADAVSASVSELTEGLKEVGEAPPTEKVRLPSFGFGRKPQSPASEEIEEPETGNGASKGSFNLGGFASKLTKKAESVGEEGSSLPALPSFDFKGLAAKVGTVKGGERKEAKPVRERAPKAKPAPKPKAKAAPAPTPEVPKKQKGGLFAQEALYVDSTDPGDF